jgi:alkanesulfonate monooxygenase
MQLRIFTEPQQGATYTDLLAVAQAAERLGYDAFFRSDHFLSMGGDGLPGPTDAWLTLAAIGRETTTIRLGTLMTSATFREPGLLAIQVAQADQMSGGRVELGIGAGWFAEEHAAYGFPFPGTPERFDRLEESLELITGLWGTPAGETYSFSGTHHSLVDSPALPKPVQSPRPPVLIGGLGRRRTPELAARFADEFNVPFASVDQNRTMFGRVDAACEAIGRDPGSIKRSSALVLCCGEDESEVSRRAAAIGRDVEELRENGLAGTPAEVVERLAAFAELGVERVYLQVLDLADLDHLELVARDVMPHA